MRQLPEGKVQELLAIKKRLGLDDPRLDGGQVAALAGSDEFLKGFSSRAIPQHTAQANGRGRGSGIAGSPSQAGQPQPLPQVPATVAGRKLDAHLGSSSATAQRRAMEDEVERLTQMITDRIIQVMGAK